MPRRRSREEHPNHERWLVSYADFITLLFAFFVVMYSISSINEGKYKILSETLTQAFKQPEQATVPIAVGDESPRTIAPQVGSEPLRGGGERVDPLQRINQQIRSAFSDLLGSEQMTIRATEQWIEIELPSGLLFPSGDAIPNDEAFQIIERVATILAPYQNPIQVEGFTDNQPISTPRYPTNWELSASRAASIVRMLAMGGVQPSRLAAVGYGEFSPVADNSTPAGRARNRRVVLVISRNLDIRRPAMGVENGTQPASDGTSTAPDAPGVNALSPAAGGNPISPATPVAAGG